MDSASEALHAPWIKDAFIFLGAAGIVVPIFHRARMGAVFGFLLVGLTVGPFGLGRFEWEYPWVQYLTIDDPERVEPFAELGIIFLLFLLGLEMSFERLWQMRRYLLGVGAVQAGGSALAIGLAAALLGVGAEAAIVLGMCLALSSTAIVMQLLREEKRTSTQVGRLTFSVLLFQDLMVVPILFIVGVLAGDTRDGLITPLATAFGGAVIAVAAIMLVGRYVARPFLRFVAQTGSRDLIMAVTVLIVVTAAGGTAAAGLSSALGAFLAGLLLSETEHRHEIEADLDPFKGLLVGLFFVTVGMSIDLVVVANHAHILVLAVLGLIMLKAAVMFAAARALGVPVATAIESSLLLAQAGEFGLVIISLARGDALFGPELAQIATSTVGLTMIATPLLAMAARYVARRAGSTANGEAPPADARDVEAEVVIVGFGRVGRIVADALENEGIGYIALDTDSELVARERKGGRPVYFGEGHRAEMLDHVGIEHAAALVASLAESEAASRIVKLCAKRWPNVAVIARARDAQHGEELRAAGAAVVLETLEPSLQLAGRVLERLGYPEERVAQCLDVVRGAELSGTKLAGRKGRKTKR